MISVLDRKALRDLWELRSQALTIALLIGAGVSVLVGSVSTWLSLSAEQQAFYAATRFAEVFAEVERAPRSLLSLLGETPGVAAVEGRVAGEARVEWPRSTTPVAAHVLSLPAVGEPRLDRLRLTAGRWPDPGRQDEAILHVAFASAWNIRPGEALSVILNGRRETFRIVGIAQSPDFVLASRPGSPLPDDRGYAVVWGSEEAVSRAYDMEGAFNQLVLSLAPGASEQAVIHALDRELAPYGNRGAYGRRDHPSHRFLEDELSQQRTTAVVLPVLFFAIAAFLLSVVLGRLVEAQREQVAALKALGYPAWPITLHYAKFVAVLCFAGSMFGIAGGYWMGVGMLVTYRPFLRFPEMPFVFPVWLLLLGVAVSFAASFIGVGTALRSILRLPAAEGLRPAAPATLAGWSPRQFGRRLPPRHKIALRDLLGRPVRTGLTILGLAFAVPLVVLGLFWRDALESMVSIQFDNILRADAVVTFTDARGSRAIRELARIPGVLAAEGRRIVPARIDAGSRTYRLGLTGIADMDELLVPRDASLRRIEIPAEGLALSRRLATRLAVEPGDMVRIEVMEGARPAFSLPVASLVEDVIGMNAYIRIDRLNRLMGEDDLVSQAALRVDPTRAAEVWRRLDESPRVAAIGVKSAWLESFYETIGSLVLISALFLTGFGLIIAIGVVYNTARVALHERGWEMASLRVLGLTRAEVSRILLAEIGVAMLAAMPLGVALSQVFVDLIVATHSTESFEIPAVVRPATFATAILIVLGAGIASAFVVRRRISRLDLIAALKARD